MTTTITSRHQAYAEQLNELDELSRRLRRALAGAVSLDAETRWIALAQIQLIAREIDVAAEDAFAVRPVG